MHMLTFTHLYTLPHKPYQHEITPMFHEIKPSHKYDHQP